MSEHTRLACIAVLTLLTTVAPVAAQSIDGYVSLMGDVLPAVTIDNGDRHAINELRARVFAERRFEVGRIRLTAAGFADGLIAADRARGTVTHAGIIRPQELHVEARWERADLRIGLSRVVWGRLDEFLPTDVVNPQDLTRFFLEGRAEGRMPVAMVRGRLLRSDRFTVEAIYVPVFRRGRFDQLGEETSPFNVAPQLTNGAAKLTTPLSDAPDRTWGNAQGGARANLTTGRVDWSMSTYRGFESLPLYEFRAPVLYERFPRFTMVGGDFETVRGVWGLRGEIAGFIERTFQAMSAPVLVQGRTIEAGVGLDRKAGDYRVSSNLVLAKRWSNQRVEPDFRAPSVVDATLPDGAIDRTDLLLVGAVDRTFARETRAVRVFGVYNPGEDSAFARVISTFHLRDNVSFEASGGWFTGDGVDALSRLATRDFVYARLKVFF